MCCLWLWIGGRWDVLPICEPVPLSVPSVVLVVGVGWSATVPAVSLSDVLPVPWIGCCCLCRWDGLPVVSSLDILPACEPVPWSRCRMVCRGQYPRHIVSGEPVPWSLSVGGMVCLCDWLPWSVSSIPCQPVSLCRGVGRMVAARCVACVC